jgi:AraC family transcriptional regulator, transcriptional activator of pobA
MKKQAHIPSYKIAEVVNTSVGERDFEFYHFEHFAHHIDHLKHPHRHDHFAIFFVTKGSGSHTIDFSDFELKPRRVFLIAPGQVHAWKELQGVKGYVLLFTREFFTLTLQYRELRAYLFSNIAQQHTCLDLEPENAHDMQVIFNGIDKENRHLKKYSEHIIRSYINVLLFDLCRAYEKSIPQVDKDDVIFMKVREFETSVNRNFKTMRSVSEYAAQLSITANYLNSICQKRKGKPAGEIIRDRMMLEARRLLTHSENSIAQIAYDLNFEDNSYFGRFFKKYSGLTPAQFRKEVKNDTATAHLHPTAAATGKMQKKVKK